jgi:hypothetical protein
LEGKHQHVDTVVRFARYMTAVAFSRKSGLYLAWLREVRGTRLSSRSHLIQFGAERDS